jgi:hypothetical protein
MRPTTRPPTAELTHLTTERARLAAELLAVARTIGSTFEDASVVCRQLTPIDDAIRAAVAQQARWDTGR